MLTFSELKFNSKTHAYTHAIYFVSQLKENYQKDAKTIDACLENLRIAFENHIQNPRVFCKYLKELSSLKLKDQDTHALKKLIKEIETSYYKQTIQQKFENPLARRFESELFISMLLSPTPSTMESVKQVSLQVMEAIEQMEKNQEDLYKFSFSKEKISYLEAFLFVLSKECGDVIACGSFSQSPTLGEVKKLLKENDPNKLPEIMHIHFKFARYIMREMPRPTPLRSYDVMGKYFELTKEYKSYFELLSEKNHEGVSARSFIANEVFSDSGLFTAESKRGRSETPFRTMAEFNQLGLMLAKQENESKELPCLSSFWGPDAKCQDPDFGSMYVRDLVENDCIYIAGFSSMTGLLLSLMEMYGGLSTLAEKQCYLSAVAAYICGGGFHSGHEVWGPAQFCLDLIPGYQVRIPCKHEIAPPPNYNIVFQQLKKIDPEFSKKREMIWDNYLKFYKNHFLRQKEIVCEMKVTAPKFLDPELSFIFQSFYANLGRELSLLEKNPKKSIKEMELIRDINAILQEMASFNLAGVMQKIRDIVHISPTSNLLFKPTTAKIFKILDALERIVTKVSQQSFFP